MKNPLAGMGEWCRNGQERRQDTIKGLRLALAYEGSGGHESKVDPPHLSLSVSDTASIGIGECSLTRVGWLPATQVCGKFGVGRCGG